MRIDLAEFSRMDFYTIELKKEFRELVKEKIYKKFKSLKLFAIKTKIIQKDYLSDILNGKRHTKLSIWFKICNALNINLDKLKINILKIKTKKKNFIKPKQLSILPSPELALLVGHGLGDGHINSYKGFEYTNKCISLHNQVLKAIHKLFNINKFNTKNKNIPTKVYNQIVGSTIHFAGVPAGNKIIQPFLVPEWIIHGSEEIKKSFIRALFDDEGTVKVNGKELLIKFSKNKDHITSLQKFMEQLKKLLKDLEIEVSSIRKEDIRYGKNGHTIQLVLGIHGYENFKKFSKKIGLDHKEKQKKLERMINNYTSFQNKKGKIQSILYKELDKLQTTYNLMNKLNISYRITYKNLRKLEERGMIRRIGYKDRLILWRKI